jgi:hypothetical protein
MYSPPEQQRKLPLNQQLGSVIFWSREASLNTLVEAPLLRAPFSIRLNPCDQRYLSRLAVDQRYAFVGFWPIANCQLLIAHATRVYSRLKLLF